MSEVSAEQKLKKEIKKLKFELEEATVEQAKLMWLGFFENLTSCLISYEDSESEAKKKIIAAASLADVALAETEERWTKL